MTLHCFENDVDTGLLDQKPYLFHHKLLGHPALELSNLARVIPALPKDRVMYSKGLLKNGDDFETTFRRRPADRSIEETIEEIRKVDSYVMIRSPEIDPTFADLHRELLSDVEALMRKQGVGETAVDPQLYLFIASPNSVTPFHIDRYSTFLMQFRGSKELVVFDAWDERVVSSENCEAYVTYNNTRLPWSPEVDALGTRFRFSPGDALHIPFVAGHHVRNGPDDVSISMSIIFNSGQSMAWRRALAFNHLARPVLGKIGMRPQPVGQLGWRDATKAGVWRSVAAARQLFR